MLRGQPAAVRHRLYLGALLLAAILPAASAWLHLAIPRTSNTGTATVLVETTASARTPAASASTGATSLPHPHFGLVLGCLWALAVLFQAAGLVRRGWRARRDLRQASPERIVAGVPVLRGPGGPFTLGWLRPRIVLPAALLEHAEWTEAALAHELAHVRRRDYLWAWLSELALLPLAWHPAAQWLAKNAALERESACDEAARAADSAYPSHLVDIASALHATPAAHAGLCLAHRRGFEQRIARLAAPAPRRSRVRMAVATAGLSLAVTAAWALGGGVRSVPAARRPGARANQSQTLQPVPVGERVLAAVCKECPAPPYPPAAKAAGVQGTVVMHVLIANDGTVTAVNCGVGDPELLAAAEDTVRGWRYHPLLLNGRPMNVSSTVTTTSALSNGRPLTPLQGLSGVVCDAQGERVAGADIFATAHDNQATSQTTTASDGSFALALPDGIYDVIVQKSGFRSHFDRVMLPQRHPGLVVLRLDHANQNLDLNAGSRRWPLPPAAQH